MGYEEDAGFRVYRLYDPIGKKVILARDVMVDESSTISNTDIISETQNAEKEKEAPTTLSQESLVNLEDFQPLDAIIPEPEASQQTMGILDSITVHPRSVL